MPATSNGSANRISDLFTAKADGKGSVSLKRIKRCIVDVSIKSNSPIIMHKWSEKAKLMIREKQQKGKKTKERELKDPQEEATNCLHVTSTGEIGVPAVAIKAAMINVAHKDLGIEKTLVRKSLFIMCDDISGVIPFSEATEPHVREDMVRVGMGSTDMRYRPQIDTWKANLSFEIDAELMQVSDLLVLLERAGFGAGLLEWRPEKGGEFGRFELDADVPLNVREIA